MPHSANGNGSGELERWVEDAGVLASVTRALTQSRRSAEARTAICEGARRVADASVAVLAEAVSEGTAMVVLEAAGANLRDTELWLGDDASGPVRALAERRPVLTAAAGAGRAEAKFLTAAGAGSIAWYPIGGAGAHVGLLAVAWEEELAEIPPRVAALGELLAAEAEFALGLADEFDRLRTMVLTDQLTGIPNRRALEEHLPREVARAARERTALALAMLDLDHFKGFNDAHGHLAGDRLLERAAAVWQQVLRPYDIIARFGGEEFVIILPGCSLDPARAIVERLRAVTPGGESCSAGVVEWVQDEHPDVLISRADGALYEAKRSGRNRTYAAPAAY